MRIGRTGRTLVLLLAAAGIALWLLDSAGLLTREQGVQRMEIVDPAELVAQEVGAPALEGRAGDGPQSFEAGESPPEHVEDWTILIEEIMGPDGKPALGVDVLLDHAGSTDTTLSWQGKPLRIRLRQLVPGEPVPPEREDMPAYRPGQPVHLSTYHDDFARWFASPLRCPPTRVSTIRVRLRGPRSLSGTVRDQDGGHSSKSRFHGVQLSIAGVPREIYPGETAYVDEEGAFVFGPGDNIPSGPLVLTAGSGKPMQDGYAVSVEVGAEEDDVALVLRPAHLFRFLVLFAEAKGAHRLVDREVVFQSEDAPPSLSPRGEADVARLGVFRRTYVVTQEAGGPLDTRWGPRDDLLLPGGAAQEWQVSVPGYRSERVMLRPAGSPRTHMVTVRLQPAVESGLLVMDVALPEGKREAGCTLRVGLQRDVPLSEQSLMQWSPGRGSHSRPAIRLPSGRRMECMVDAHVAGEGPWMVRRFPLDLIASQTHVQKAQIIRGGYVYVTRKHVGGRMPGLRVRLMQGGMEWSEARWFSRGDLVHRTVYGTVHMLAEPGPCEVGLVRAGRPLGWSQTVMIEAGRLARVHLPDVETLK